jgi:hypothetical protein
LGIGPNPQSPIPNPQSPIPNPHINSFWNNYLFIQKIKKIMKFIFLFIGLFLKIHYIIPNPIFIKLDNNIKTSLYINETEYYFFAEAKQNQFINISYWNHSSTLECENDITFYELKLGNEPESYDISQSLDRFPTRFIYDNVENHYWQRIEVLKKETNYIGFKLSFRPEYNDTIIEIKVDSIGSNFYLENNTEFTLNNVKFKTPYFLYVKVKHLDTVNLQLILNNCTDNNPLLDDWVFWYLFSIENSESFNSYINVSKNYIKKGNEFRFSFSHLVKDYDINYIAFKLVTAYNISSVVAIYNIEDVNNQKEEKEKKNDDDNKSGVEKFMKKYLKYIFIIGIALVIFLIVVILCIKIKSRKKSKESEIYRTKDTPNPLLP